MFTNTKGPVIIIVLLLGLFLAAAWFGYNKLSTDITDPLQAFPESSSFVIEIPEPDNFFEKLNTENDFWLDILNHTKFNELNTLFQSIIEKSNSQEKLSTLFNQPFYFSVHNQPELNSNFILITKKNGLSLEILNTKVFAQIKGLSSSVVEGDVLMEKVQYRENIFFIAQSHGLFLIGSSAEILLSSIAQIPKEKGFIQSVDFNRLKMTRGKRADAFLYISYEFSDDLLKSFLHQDGINTLESRQFANFSVLDIILKKDELLLNGYTSAYDSLNHYLAAFKGQKGQVSQLAATLPYLTKSYIGINLSDYQSFTSAQNTSSLYKEERKQLDALVNGNTLKITEQWWAGEMALVMDQKYNEYAVFTAKSGREAFRLLSDIAHQSQPHIITIDYRDYKIKEINYPHFLTSQFGSLFSNFAEVYFCVIDETVIFSKTISDLQNYIDEIIQGNNLSKNEAYIEFSDNLSDDAIIRVYSNTLTNSHPIFKLFLDQGKKLFKNANTNISNIKGVGIQISNKNDLFYTGMIIKHGISSIEKSSAWQIELDGRITAGPFIVKNHASSGNSILVQDEFNTLYYINEKGDIVWSQSIREPIISKTFSVDYFKNGKWQYLFNTSNFLYLIDINGNAVSDYPIQLNATASNGIQVLDYNNKKDYRIIIACANGELYNYEINGRLLKDWNAENTRKEIVKPLTHLITNKKDYLIFEAKNGNILMTDRRGSRRMEIRKSFINALGSDLYVNITNQSKGLMLTTDQKGNLVYIPEEGAINSTSFGQRSENHYFIYSDFSNNKVMDFIFLDGKELRVYDKFKNILLSHDFNNTIPIKPLDFKLENKTYLGVVDPIEKQLYLFNKEGILTNKVLKGNTEFVVGKLNKNASASLLIGLDKSLFSYPLD